MTSSLILHTLLALLLLALPIGALYVLDRPSIKPLAFALAKGLGQLLACSLIVWGVYKSNHLSVSIGWLFIMSIWAGWLISTKCKLSVKRYLLPASAGVFTGTLLIGLWLLVAVLPIDTISARWCIPVMTILFGHTTTMQIRGLSHVVTTLQNNRTQYDFLLGNGASPWQALTPFIRSSLLAILSPTIANLSALSLVALPLLLCGMLLGGFSPINAFAVMVYAILGGIASSVLALGISIVIIKSLKLLS